MASFGEGFANALNAQMGINQRRAAAARQQKMEERKALAAQRKVQRDKSLVGQRENIAEFNRALTRAQAMADAGEYSKAMALLDQLQKTAQNFQTFGDQRRPLTGIEYDFIGKLQRARSALPTAESKARDQAAQAQARLRAIERSLAEMDRAPAAPSAGGAQVTGAPAASPGEENILNTDKSIFDKDFSNKAPSYLDQPPPQVAAPPSRQGARQPLPRSIKMKILGFPGNDTPLGKLLEQEEYAAYTWGANSPQHQAIQRQIKFTQGITPASTMTLVDRYTALSKPYRETQAAHDTMMLLYEEAKPKSVDGKLVGNNAAQLAMIYQFFIAQDPGGRVTEGEVEMTGRARSLGRNLLLALRKLDDGGVLDDKDLQEFIAVARRSLEARIMQQIIIGDAYKKLAENQGFDSSVLPDWFRIPVLRSSDPNAQSIVDGYPKGQTFVWVDNTIARLKRKN